MEYFPRSTGYISHVHLKKEAIEKSWKGEKLEGDWTNLVFIAFRGDKYSVFTASERVGRIE